LEYQKITDTITLTSDKVKNYTLQESTETLEEVLIKAEMAVIVKEDTFIFTTEKFQTIEYITSYSINSYSLFNKTQFIL
jgi:alpha-tubulin suppressor-like RCC1 family protein